MAMEVTLAEVKPLIIDVLKAGLVPNLLSSPGIGKSALAKQIATLFNLKLIDIRLSYYDPADLNGFPFILDAKAERVRAGYVPMETFPIEGDPLPVKTWKTVNGISVPDTYYSGWLLLCDEFNSAPQSVQAAAYKLILDKCVGMHRLHKSCAVMTAGNLLTDKAIVQRLSTAMQSRIVSFVLRVCKTAWRKWADTENIDHRVKSFIEYRPELLHKFDPNHSELTFPCPRTWEFTSRIIKPMPQIAIQKLPLLAGTVGEGTAQEFYSYTQVFPDLLKIPEIVADPMGCRLSPEKSIHYALSGLITEEMTLANATALTQFLTRLDIDFQVVTLRSAISKNRDLRTNKEIQKWISINAEELLD